jgi:hypothetical protein
MILLFVIQHYFSFLHAALWNQCTETKDCSLIHGLLVAYMYLYTKQQNRYFRVNAS